MSVFLETCDQPFGVKLQDFFVCLFLDVSHFRYVLFWSVGIEKILQMEEQA